MNLKEYLVSKSGKGVLSSSDKAGKVTSAIYSKPHVFDDGKVAFVMRQRLTYENLKSNPHASYMFIEDGEGYQGIRLFLTKTNEDTDSELIETMKRRHLTHEEDKAKGPKYLVYFEVNEVLPLVGSDNPRITLI